MNSVVSNGSLLQFIGQFLAENPTNIELVTKYQCLLAIFYWQVAIRDLFEMKRDAIHGE